MSDEIEYWFTQFNIARTLSAGRSQGHACGDAGPSISGASCSVRTLMTPDGSPSHVHDRRELLTGAEASFAMPTAHVYRLAGLACRATAEKPPSQSCRRSLRSLLSRNAAIDLGRELYKGIRNLHRIRCVPFQAPQTLGQALQLAGCVCTDLGKRRLRLNSLPGPHHKSQ